MLERIPLPAVMPAVKQPFKPSVTIHYTLFCWESWVFGIYKFRTKQNQCSVDPKRKKRNLILVTVIILVLGVGIFLSLEKWSSWYFDEYVVPAQQKELFEKK